MNDATALETSFAGAIDFFQNLHRKLGALEADVAARHESLAKVAASLEAFRQDQQGDHQALAALASHCETQLGQLPQMRLDIEKLQQQWHQFEILSRTLQEEQQSRQTLATVLQADLQAQHHALRDDFEARLEAIAAQKTIVISHIDALKERLSAVNEILQHHQQRQDAFQEALDKHQSTDSIQAQQNQLEALAESFTALNARLQTVQLDLLILNRNSESEEQRQLTQTELQQARQELQKHQDRFKYLETLVTKLSSDTHSTRQILNVLQSDLSVQSDTLRVLDQTWQDGLTHYQQRLSGLENSLSQPLSAPANPRLTPAITAVPDEASSFSTTLSEESPFLVTPSDESEESPFLVAPSDESSETPSIAPNPLSEHLSEPPSALQTDELLALREALTTQSLLLDQLQQSLEQKLVSQNQRLDALETRIDTPSSQPTPALQADLEPLKAAVAEQAGALAEWRDYTQQRWTTLSTLLANQGEEFQTLLTQLTELQQQIAESQEQASLDVAASQPVDSEALTQTHQVQQHLELLQETVAGLETRLTGQAQAFSSNFEQFQSLNIAIQELQQQLGKLDSSRRLSMIEQLIAAQEQTVTQLAIDLQHTKEEAQQVSEVAQTQGTHSKLEEMATRLDQQYEQLISLSATVDAIRSNNKATQEKILTMAANVAQRLHEFQNQLVAAKTTQGEQLQAVEQKLIVLQAAVETMETQRKSRRWFSMPASLTTVVLVIGATLLAILTQFS